MRKLILSLFIISTLASCASTNYGVYDNTLSKADISQDIKFIKRKLLTQHYDLNWEGRQDRIIKALDSLAASTNKINVRSFRKALKPIFEQVDDGHTDVMAEVEMDLLRAKSNKPFQCYLLEKKTAYLKIPHFMDGERLNNVLGTFRHLINEHEAERIVIDLRSNPGGSVEFVRKFLQTTISDSRLYCMKQRTRLASGLSLPVKLILRAKGEVQDGFVLLHEYQDVKPSFDFEIENKYLLVDSTIISGSMIAAYHLKEDGYLVIGSAPDALFNSFMNPVFFSLPRSKLYMAVSTGRFHLNENVNNRAEDQLIPDVETKVDYSLKGLMNAIRQIEAIE